ncbi:hypothetical protein CSOJ01_09559 [Colletotrichum sojae]|uniref:Uncharacterized protein n=1 Tax=Colletotrichum sojae TaxID=2175907 RepID=A0A8H6J363_9PEZI|nr:hypothetical protein CSOJ01_09559 [Colletotrichum sojae]
MLYDLDAVVELAPGYRRVTDGGQRRPADSFAQVRKQLIPKQSGWWHAQNARRSWRCSSPVCPEPGTFTLAAPPPTVNPADITPPSFFNTTTATDGS